MRQLGVIAVPNANPKLTHGAELPTNHPVTPLVEFQDASYHIRAVTAGNKRKPKLDGRFGEGVED
jgi:hypothetical protein